MNIAEALRGIFLFEALDERQLRLAAECATLCAVEKGEHMYREGDEAQAFFAVLQGQCKIYRLTPAGDEFIVHIQQAGDLIAEAAMFDVRRYPASCVAMEDSTVLRVDSLRFTALLLAEPTMALRLLHAYSRRLRSFVTALEDLSLRDVKARFANYLLRNCEETPEGHFCAVPFSKRELATLLGTIPETLSRTLRDFKSRGLVLEGKGGFLLIEPAGLRAYASE